MSDAIDELRRRLDVPADLVPDELLASALAVSRELILPWVSPENCPPTSNTYETLIDEATLQLAVKVYDVSGRGVATMDAGGEWVIMPAPSATPGLVRSVFGVLGPALATGGISV